MIYNIKPSKEFLQDMLKLRENAPKLYQKVRVFLEELKEHPRTGTGHPEQLRHCEHETWSRQINKQHRLVYEIHDDIVLIILLSAYGHYEDKYDPFASSKNLP